MRKTKFMRTVLFALIAVAMLSLLTLVSCDIDGDFHTHSFGEWTVAEEATCTGAGNRVRSCSCGETETENISATGHTEVAVSGTSATCAEGGLSEGKKCKECGEILLKQENIARLGHQFDCHTETDENGNEIVIGVCQRQECGLIQQQNLPGLYAYDGHFIASWDDLISIYGLDIKKDYDSDSLTNEKSHIKYILQNYEELAEATRLVVSNNISEIGNYSFYGCYFLTIVELPNSIKDIGIGVFFGCDLDIYYKGTSEEWEEIDRAETFISSNTIIYYDGKIEFLITGFVGYWGSSGIAGIIKKIVVDGEKIYVNKVLYEANRLDGALEINYPIWFKDPYVYGYEEERLTILDEIKLCQNWYVLEKVESDDSKSKIAVCYLDNTYYFITFVEENDNILAQSVFRTSIGG